MKNTIHHLLRLCAIGALLFACIGNSHAQLHDNAANCNELKDPDVMFQMDLCKAHAGCRMVMGIHSTCVKAKKFFTNLKEQIGEGVKGLFGYRKEVTSDMVFEASMDDKQREVEKDKKWKSAADSVREGLKTASKEQLNGKFSDGSAWTYIGDMKTGAMEGKGTVFFSTGEILRGEFSNGKRDGAVDEIQPTGVRTTANYVLNEKYGEGNKLMSNGEKYQGEYAVNKRSGRGVYTFPNGQRYEGEFQNDDYHGQGVLYRADGTVVERGIYEKDKLYVGKRYNAKGDVIAEVNKPLDEQKAREAAQKVAAEDMAAAQKQRDAQAAMDKAAADRQRQADADRAYRDSLAQMNAGQLFAKADELNSAGDKTKAREVLRTLVSRFPDHPLAATAAQQMTASGNVAGTTGSSSGVQNSANTSSNSNCDKALSDLGSRLQQIERRPLPAGATPGLHRVMYMAEETIKVTRANCPNEGKYAKSISEMQRAFTEAKTACGQLSMSESSCVANPYDGTITPAMRAEREREKEREQAAAAAAEERLAQQKAEKEAADWAKAAQILTDAIVKRRQQQSGGRRDNSNCSPHCTVR
jgi:hypothetical protein